MTLKESILRLRKKGLSYTKIMLELHCSKSLIAYHVNNKVKQKMLHRQSVNRKKFMYNLKQLHNAKCNICSYNKCLEALEFHHLDPTKKKFVISNHSRTGGHDKVIEESYKCILLCANCHRELHAGLFKVEPKVGNAPT